MTTDASAGHGADDHGSGSVAAAAEKRWGIVIALIIMLLVGLMVFTSLHWASMPPSRVETIDPRTLHVSGEFVESNLGTTLTPDGKVVVRLVAQQYSFQPQCLVVPAGMPVTFRATSSDALHGFVIGRTNANVMLVPGFVATFTTTFKETGEQLMPCHEYCGAGHEAMWARVRVIPAADFISQSRNGERLSCVPR
ncbi:MAG: cytochrome C oxidase subunit II [Pseudomonadota bacterium]|nr:cytochrome C oxidase subunit II [Pseudomonadota bacterium]